MKFFRIILLFLFFGIVPLYGQISSYDFPYQYTLKGKSGYNERFAPESYDESETQKVVLQGLTDSLHTVVRRLYSSYDKLQYLIFDNIFYENGEIRNEINVQSIYFSGERARTGDWGLKSKHRLSNGNILVVASIHHVSPTVTYIYRFMIFDKTGRNLIARKDYCFLEQPKILQEINGGFSVVVGKDYSPILIDDYVIAGNDKVESFATAYRQSIPAVCITRFDDEANVVKKNSYLLHEDPNVKSDKILDVINDTKYNYVLVISNMTGVVNQPTLASLIVQRDRPSVFAVENLYEDNSIDGIKRSSLKKEYGKIYAYLPMSDKGIEIKSQPKETPLITNENNQKTKAVEQLTNAREIGNKILAANGIKAQCMTYTETPHGIFIGIRLEDNTPVNYLYVKNKLSPFPILDSYVIFGYGQKFDGLIVGFRDKTIRFADTMSRDFSIYYLETQRMVKQVKYTSDVYKVQLSNEGDSLACWVNTKNPGGVGSSVVRKASKIVSE